MNKVIGKVTPEERDKIQYLFERRNGLTELAKIITAEDQDLYEKVVNDLGKTMTQYQQWWDDLSLKYNWESEKDKQWQINFESCEIYLK